MKDIIFDPPTQFFFKSGNFSIVGREEGKAVDLLTDISGNSRSKGCTFHGTGSAADFIHKHQT